MFGQNSYLSNLFVLDDLVITGESMDNIIKFDATEITLKILSSIYRSEEKYGVYLIAAALCGRRNKKIEEFKLDKLSTFGIVSDFTVNQIRAIIFELLRRDLIYRSTEHSNLKLTDKGKQYIKLKPKLILPKKILDDARTGIFSKRLLTTHFGTLALLQKGLKIPEIAKMRNLKETTIEDHISDLVFHHKIRDISLIVSKDKEQLIRTVLTGTHDNLKLKAIKEKLPPDISYGQIKIVLALYNK